MPSQPNNVQVWINEAVNKHAIVIFSKSYCPYCQNTKALMKRNHWEAQVYELDQMINGESIQEQLRAMTGQGTVPSVWINGKFLGGNSDIQMAFRSGELAKMVMIANNSNTLFEIPSF